MNIMMGGQLVVVYSIGSDIKRIGVQSVYEGGGETNLSEIGSILFKNAKRQVTAWMNDDRSFLLPATELLWIWSGIRVSATALMSNFLMIVQNSVK